MGYLYSKVEGLLLQALHSPSNGFGLPVARVKQLLDRLYNDSNFHRPNDRAMLVWNLMVVEKKTKKEKEEKYKKESDKQKKKNKKKKKK